MEYNTSLFAGIAPQTHNRQVGVRVLLPATRYLLPAICYLLPAIYYLLPTHFLAGQLSETTIKVGILVNAKKFNIGSEGKYYLYNMDTGDKEVLSDGDIHLVTVTKTGFSIGNKKISLPSSTVRLSTLNDKHCIRINGKKFRGSILIKRNEHQSLSVINEVDIEDYCDGILPYEADTDWRLEALKVQAVVSRTYALKNLGKHASSGYDFCNTVCCQVYKGADGEKEISNNAVDETRGEVITYNGKLANVFYHACCAGHTENPKNVWSWPIPVPDYLKGVECNFCKSSPHFNWTKTIDEKTIRKGLIKSGYSGIVKIHSIELYGKTTSDRIRDIIITYKSKNGKRKKIVLNAARFRLAISPFLVKSTKITQIKKVTKDTFEFSGNGWGHGVGLCQWGAKFMSDKGHNYKQIIQFYFPETQIDLLSFYTEERK